MSIPHEYPLILEGRHRDFKDRMRDEILKNKPFKIYILLIYHLTSSAIFKLWETLPWKPTGEANKWQNHLEPVRFSVVEFFDFNPTCLSFFRPFSFIFFKALKSVPYWNVSLLTPFKCTVCLLSSGLLSVIYKAVVFDRHFLFTNSWWPIIFMCAG